MERQQQWEKSYSSQSGPEARVNRATLSRIGYDQTDTTPGPVRPAIIRNAVMLGSTFWPARPIHQDRKERIR